MSGKRIVEIVEPCKHGRYDPHYEWASKQVGLETHTYISEDCRGGSRRTLTEGQYVLFEKESGEWPMWLADVLGDVVHTALGGLPHEPSRCAAIALGILGALAASAEHALSDHTEGAP